MVGCVKYAQTATSEAAIEPNHPPPAPQLRTVHYFGASSHLRCFSSTSAQSTYGGIQKSPFCVPFVLETYELGHWAPAPASQDGGGPA